MRLRRSEQEWKQYFEQFARSGLTRDAFCADNGVALSTFDRWQRKIRARAASTGVSAGFVEISRPVAPIEQCESGPQHAEVVLELPLGIVLRIQGLAH